MEAVILQNGSCGVNQKKRVETRHSSVAESISGKPGKPEMDLADLVAQVTSSCFCFYLQNSRIPKFSIISLLPQKPRVNTQKRDKIRLDQGHLGE